jgi:dynein heavy chain
MEENDYGKLKVTIETMIDDKDLIKNPVFVTKVIQLFETFNVRFGVMLVGATGSAKTRCYEMLEATMNHLREKEDPDPAF